MCVCIWVGGLGAGGAGSLEDRGGKGKMKCKLAIILSYYELHAYVRTLTCCCQRVPFFTCRADPHRAGSGRSSLCVCCNVQ